MFGAAEAEGTWNSSHLAGWTTKNQNKNQPKATQVLGIIKQGLENKAQKTKHH